MNVLLINGSPRTNGNTKQALEMMETVFKKHGLNPIHIQLGGKHISGCKACQTCFKQKNKQCVIQDDLQPIINQMFDENTKGIVIGSPTYFSNVTAEVKALIDRSGYVAMANDNPLKGKVGTPIAICRRAGASFVYAAINYFFGIVQMPIATSSYWNMSLSRAVGDVQKDAEAQKTFVTLAENMSQMICKLNK